VNLRGYWEFWSENRLEGKAAYLTLSIPLGIESPGLDQEGTWWVILGENEGPMDRAMLIRIAILISVILIVVALGLRFWERFEPEADLSGSPSSSVSSRARILASTWRVGAGPPTFPGCGAMRASLGQWRR
jgi:hypothetical protein